MTDCLGNNKASIPVHLNKRAMHPLLSLCVLWLLPLALTLDEDSPLDCVPRRSVPYHSECCITLDYILSSHLHVDSWDLSLDWQIEKRGWSNNVCWVVLSYSVRRGQCTPVSRGGGVQLLNHAVERRPRLAGTGCQGGSVCTWSERHLQETCCGKNPTVMMQFRQL